ncbi:hypothetical protein [Geminocystis herdmanii]|uniref:hypothetical protein n=1 Tax=Geminocystis herdmanii TaxID=669359 RepID=UPI0003471904|nr:hypothetical protein [Geminocystis herdmanii]
MNFCLSFIKFFKINFNTARLSPSPPNFGFKVGSKIFRPHPQPLSHRRGETTAKAITTNLKILSVLG